MQSPLIKSTINTDIYQALLRNLRRRRGFGMVFVRCYPVQGKAIIQKVKADLTQKKIDVLELETEINHLYDLIKEKKNNDLDILFITGIEKSFVNYIKPGIGGQGDYYKLDTIPALLGHLNWHRERFRDDFNCCLVFLVPLFALKYLLRRSPDFYDWRSGVFEVPMDRDQLEKESLRTINEGNYNQYLSWTIEARNQKILEINELIAQPLQNESTKVDLLFEMGLLYAANINYQEAIEAWNKALEIKPDYDEAWNNRGIALGNLGRYEEAIASYDQALEIKP
ncbi:MAG TPA: hypothetical protein DCF68_09705, partial [Cyanothece sp. UBA12306]|nr:hypothetical protein [Cyanothece sp. UBA12306]